MATNKNDIISQLPDCSSSGDEKLYISHEHLSSFIEEKLETANDRKREIREGNERRSVSKDFR